MTDLLQRAAEALEPFAEMADDPPDEDHGWAY
jgi:hypothetical protein